MKLPEYIKHNYSGNQSAFAKANGLSKQAVNGMIKKGFYYVYDGMLCLSKRNVK